MKSKEYNRIKAVEYATKWAFKRNPKYYNFDSVGGDCTSFISQCIYAGCNTMNYKKHIGWYYNSSTDRTASWSGVEFLYNFLTTNKGAGPRGVKTKIDNLEIGDIVQLVYDNNAYHNMIISKVILEGEYLIDYLICQHTIDLLDYPLSLKEGERRYIKILGYYK